MASYNELLALIDAYINQNGVQAITGQVLNGVLRAMVDQLGRGYSIMGAADPTTDPGTPDGPETWFASVPGTYTNFDGIQIVDGELALLSYEPSAGFSKNTIYEGFQTVQATIDGNVGTPAVGVSYANGILSFDFHNMKGVTGDPAGFGAVTASVDSNIGTPSVQVQTSGPDTAKAIAFQFHNLKGETGVTSVLATVDNTSGNPQCAVSLNGQQLVLNFTGLKGAQGDTGSSVDYPFTIVNNLTTNDATQALSAAMGVQLESEVSQLEAKVDELGGYEDNPEFLRVYTDNDGRVVWGIRPDGEIYFGVGCPQQIREYVLEKIHDADENVLAFLDGLEEGAYTLPQLLSQKVDKVAGKSLIDDNIINSIKYEDNPEYIEVKTDNEGKVIEGITNEGKKEIDIPLSFMGFENNSVETPEWLRVITDKDGKVICGLRADGKLYADLYESDEKGQELKVKLSTFKKISIIGDSISTFNKKGFKIDGFEMWYPYPNDRSSDVISVEDTWWKKVINFFGGIIEVNASYSGSTASSYSVGFAPRVPLIGNPDLIFIALGSNDSGHGTPIGDFDYDTNVYDTSKFAPSYIKGIKDCRATYPKAEIICIAFDMDNAYQNAISTIAEHYGLKYIYVGDISDVHPNKSEMQAVANRIICNCIGEKIVSLLLGLLPVSNGVGVESGSAYIDSSDRCVKVKS